jgi:hypothetical protein
VICEDTEDEKDLIGIWGVHWKEMDQTEFLLKEIFDKSLTDASHQTDSANHDDVISDIELGDNKTDAESDVDLDGNHRLGGDGNTQDESFELRKPPTVLPLCVGALDRKDDVWAHLPKVSHHNRLHAYPSTDIVFSHIHSQAYMIVSYQRTDHFVVQNSCITYNYGNGSPPSCTFYKINSPNCLRNSVPTSI